MLIAKTERLFISYTRFFLDVLILEDGADKLTCSVSNKLSIDATQHPTLSKNS
jgi:hypothetical protein